jgi:hypothetical protein
MEVTGVAVTQFNFRRLNQSKAIESSQIGTEIHRIRVYLDFHHFWRDNTGAGFI